MKYTQITEYCKKCAGCNKLEDINFRGVIKCKDHIELVAPKKKNNWYIKENRDVKN